MTTYTEFLIEVKKLRRTFILSNDFDIDEFTSELFLNGFCHRDIESQLSHLSIYSKIEKSFQENVNAEYSNYDA